MKINLTDAQKTVLANYLAEKRTRQDIEHLEKVLSSEKISDDTEGNVREYHFNYYKNILNETDDY